ncbi:hypothetical protein EVJ58_g8845 [Rhodofomes roseus]|uniref:Uncharacterized protein n=1 Tax=Rhodofomes roseus TaxID=34475 RepID=A0A4Y9Y0T8_9APHY|nr:hypothetical protein EVJ58_g8845 [Rhodofomes roseus]
MIHPTSHSILLKIDDLIAQFKYVPYSSLTPAAHQKAAQSDEAFVVDVDRSLKLKAPDQKSECSISLVDWLDAGKMVVAATCKHFGADRADRLTAHHGWVEHVTQAFGWDVAVEYDIREREAAAENPRHNLSTYNDKLALMIVVQGMQAQAWVLAGIELAPHFVSEYIASEQAAGRYSQAFKPDELEHLIGPFRTSPLGLVPKPHSNKFWMIQDLSFPRNNPIVTSVNAGINPDEFPTAWGTFDETVELVLSLPPGCVAATFDISAAYRITPVCPDQQQFFCINWEGLVHVDFMVAFGCSLSTGVFGSIANMLVAIYLAHGFGPIKKWVDDFFAICFPGQLWTEEDFIALTARLGVPWSHLKLQCFASRQRYIGFDWDLDANAIGFPADKLSATQQLVRSWQVPRASFTAAEAASVHGKLVHAATIFPLIRPFLCSAAHFAQDYWHPRAHWHPPSLLIADLAWVSDLLAWLPPVVPLRAYKPYDLGWWGDASTSFGVGVVVGECWAVWRWAPGFKVGPGEALDIGWAEAVAVKLGLHMVIARGQRW